MLRLLLARTFAGKWPGCIAYPATLLIIALAYAAGRWVWPSMQVYPFFFFFPAIIVSAALFNHGCGYLATIASTLLIARHLPPKDSFVVAETRDWLALGMFLAVGLVLCALLEQLREALRRAQAAESQSELFLREAVHRFKNDLTIVTALLRSQGRQLEDVKAKAALSNTANRVLVMSRVHERLRVGRGAAAVVNTQEFIGDLCADLKASLLDLRPVSIEVQAEAHALPHERAVAVGLIINEALTNALKYAFPEGRTGMVGVVFRRRGGEFMLQVKDDGVGFDPDRPPRTGGLGRRLVQSMAQQLDGCLAIEPDEGAPGTLVTVTFPATTPCAEAQQRPPVAAPAP
ncbi:sensor histidine kinase [Methylobacterium radiotolerans]|uniref:sensor histidine kinase n=1 Tax=Methylobacterium radiotolerans TaxID=31998 RepID=UPI0038CFEECA